MTAADQGTLFTMPGPTKGSTRKPGETSWPAWYRPSKSRKTQGANVVRGRHPLGSALGPEDSTCGDCVNLSWTGGGKRRHFKCGRVRKLWTRGPASDLFRRWRGCEHFGRRMKRETVRPAPSWVSCEWCGEDNIEQTTFSDCGPEELYDGDDFRCLECGATATGDYDGEGPAGTSEWTGGMDDDEFQDLPSCP